MKAIANPFGPIWAGSADLLVQKILKEVPGRKFMAVTDSEVAIHCLPGIRPVLDLFKVPVLEVPSGEENKQITTCTMIWEKMAELGMGRGDALIALGGGMITDLTGFVAACYMRGIDLISIPTTLLAQVDAALGGKTGVDLGALKNYVGAFRQPAQVLIDHRFLETLPERQLRNGLAEVIKHALIAGGPEWDYWSNGPDVSAVNWADRVNASAAIKLGIAGADPEEKGLRKVLNLGHSIGHALESIALEDQEDWLHGEAVAAGIWCEAWIAAELGMMPMEHWDMVRQVLDRYFPHRELPVSTKDRLDYFLQRDKKNATGRIRIIALKRPGEVSPDLEISSELAIQSLEAYGR